MDAVKGFSTLRDFESVISLVGCCWTRVASYCVPWRASDQQIRASLRATAHNAAVVGKPFATSRAYCALNGFAGSRAPHGRRGAQIQQTAQFGVALLGERALPAPLPAVPHPHVQPEVGHKLVGMAECLAVRHDATALAVTGPIPGTPSNARTIASTAASAAVAAAICRSRSATCASSAAIAAVSGAAAWGSTARCWRRPARLRLICLRAASNWSIRSIASLLTGYGRRVAARPYNASPWLSNRSVLARGRTEARYALARFGCAISTGRPAATPCATTIRL